MLLVCPRCLAGDLDAGLVCEACGAEMASLRVDDGPPVALLLDDEDAATGAHACTEILERLDNDGNTFASDFPEALAGYVSALAIYGGAHFGRFADPALEGPDLSWIARALATTRVPDGPALLLGAATAGEALAIPGDREIVALDGSIPMLGFASGLAAKDQWLPVQRTPGRYGARRIVLPDDVRARLRASQLVAGDARQPPFHAGTFALVVCLNVIDSITHPREVLLQAQALLRPGGVLLVASPYNWSAEVTADDRRLDAAVGPDEDHASAMEAVLAQLLPHCHPVWRDREVPWTLRIHDRLTCAFRLHALLLRCRPH